MRRMGATYHLDELAVLNHHSVDDSEEGLVRGEEASASCEGVSLHHTLASMFRQDFNNTTTAGARSNVPLEVSACVFEDGIELVRDELIGREDPECLWVSM